ncbi:MAG: hypothetical protein GX660_12405, partial [Clostridiaceae bacterium]|nr:hypothetical protein [Clostridiaceae bacterium]
LNHTGNTDTPFMYNGRDGVMTDANGLYYMRARYYNPEIKRFINQDVLTGSISDGRTLNRYAYVNGNPVSLTDPFGLSPSLSEIGHSVLDVLGFIPGIGDVLDLVNAAWYLLEGNWKEAGLAAISVIPVVGSFLGKGIKWGSKAFKTFKFGSKILEGASKVYDFSRPVTRAISNVVTSARTTKIGRILTSNIARDAIISGVTNAGLQKLVTGEVNWKSVGFSSLLGVGVGALGRKLSGGSSGYKSEGTGSAGVGEGTELFRKTANTGAFEGLSEPMQLRHVQKVAKEAGIGLDGIKIKIVRDPELIGKGVCGYASPKGNVIELYPDAFTNTESLVKTLGHERTHIYQVKTFGPAVDTTTLIEFEKGAWGSESSWWDFFNRKGK